MVGKDDDIFAACNILLIKDRLQKVDYVVFDSIIHISVPFNLYRKEMLFLNESDWAPGCPLFPGILKVWSLCRLAFSYLPFFKKNHVIILKKMYVLWHVIVLNTYNFLKKYPIPTANFYAS